MDLLAIAVADPTVLPLWAAFLFAVGMYPVGMFFGCTPCCDPCVCASGATLPDTITVTLDGFNATPDDDPPPDTNPEVSLTITSQSGADAQLTAVLGEVTFFRGGVPFVLFGIQSVTINNAGNGYTDNDNINVILGEGTLNVNQLELAELRLLTGDNGAITGVDIWFPGNYWRPPVFGPRRSDCCGHYLNGKQFVLRRLKDSNADCGLETIGFTKNGQSFSAPASCVYTHRFCGGWTAEQVNSNGVFHETLTTEYELTFSPFLYLRELQLYVAFLGEGQPAVAKLERPCGYYQFPEVTPYACEQTWVSDSEIELCSEFSWSATNYDDEDHPAGPSISVSPGGSYDPQGKLPCDENTPPGQCLSCHVCCQGDESMPVEIEAQVTNTQRANVPGWDPLASMYPQPGTYVLSRERGPHIVGLLANVNFDAYRYVADLVDGNWEVRIQYEPCTDFADFRDPAFVDCKTCVKKCRVRADIMAASPGQESNYFWFQDWRGIQGLPGGDSLAHAEDHCGKCEDVPICSLEGRTFTLCPQKTLPWTNLGVGELTVNGQTYDDGCGDVTITT